MSRCEPVTGNLPPLKDLTADNITENVIRINNQSKSPRARFVFERLVTHLHDFAREVQLSEQEWSTSVEFLTKIGQMSTDTRHEMILLSDTLGLSMLLDSINHPKSASSTEGTVLGPFHTHDAIDLDHGAVLHKDPHATPLLVLCDVKDPQGNPISGVKIDVWEGDSHGFYDVQREDRSGPDGRGVLHSDSDGRFFFKAIVPVPYPIPSDGPVGAMLRLLGRHVNRPSHIHFMMHKEGWDPLTTALYPRGDPYEASDAVFGVKESLVVDFTEVSDPEMAARYDVALGTKLLQYNFVLLSMEEAAALKRKNAIKNMEKYGGKKMSFLDGLPVPDLD